MELTPRKICSWLQQMPPCFHWNSKYSGLSLLFWRNQRARRVKAQWEGRWWFRKQAHILPSACWSPHYWPRLCCRYCGLLPSSTLINQCGFGRGGACLQWWQELLAEECRKGTPMPGRELLKKQLGVGGKREAESPSPQPEAQEKSTCHP